MRRVFQFVLVLTVAVGVAGAESPGYQEAFWVKKTEAKRAVASPRVVKASAVAAPAFKHPLAVPGVATPKHEDLKAASAPSEVKQVAADGVMSVMGKQNQQSTPWAIVIGLTLLTLLPAILLAMTPMVRLLVVFHFLRQALGTQTAPSNQVLMGLALMMTWFLMQPVLLQVDQQALVPYRAGQISATDAIERGSQPVKEYMLHYAREKDLAVFVSASHTARPAKPADLPMPVVVPAYILSELKAGFQIGAVLFLPFLLIDFLVASITTSIGMLQLSPVVISTPVKILLFVMVDGWTLLADQLLKSF